MNKKSNHIEMKKEDGIYPIIAEGKHEISPSLVDETVNFLERNANYSNKHKEIALRTISYLSGVYSTKDKVREKFDKAIDRIEQIKTAQIKLEDVREDKSTCDLTLLSANHEKVTDHLSYLMQLPFFKNLSEKERIIKEKSVNLQQFPKATVETVLDFVYGLPPPENISVKDLIWVYSLADFFHIDDVKEFTLQAFKKELEKNPDSLIDALIFTLKEREKAISKSEEKEREPGNIQSPIEAFFPILKNCYEQTKTHTITESKFREVIPYFEALAEQNDPFAQTALAACYKIGIGVEKDLNKAIELYMKASEQEYAPAQVFLGEYYQSGTFIEKDEDQATELFTKASEQGYAKGQNSLGYCYLKGIGIEKDLTRAVELFTLASEQGYAPAQSNLGFCYENGLGVEEEENKAFELFLKASEQGNAIAQDRLGVCFQDGFGVKRDEKKAFELFLMASEQGIIEAQHNLGLCYLDGTGIKRDIKKGLELCNRACEQGYAPAQSNLALRYIFGIRGVKMDLRRIFELSTKASEQGDELGQYCLGVCYEEGYGVEKNKEQAIELYIKASDQGNDLAKIHLKSLGRPKRLKGKEDKLIQA